MGTRCGPNYLKGQFRDCPRNCRRRATPKDPLGQRPGRIGRASTRKSGDLPLLILTNPGGVPRRERAMFKTALADLQPDLRQPRLVKGGYGRNSQI